MAAGNKTYEGLALPKYGEATMEQTATGTDMLTLNLASGDSGDFLVCTNNADAEKFVIAATGALTVAAGGITVTAGDVTVTAGDVAITKGYFLRFSDFYTTGVPTTGMTKGDIFITMRSSTPQIAVCTDSTGQTLRYFTSNTATFGRASTT